MYLTAAILLDERSIDTYVTDSWTSFHYKFSIHNTWYHIHLRGLFKEDHILQSTCTANDNSVSRKHTAIITSTSIYCREMMRSKIKKETY